MPTSGTLPCMIGLSWLAVLSMSNLPFGSAESHAHPLPNRVIADFVSSSFSLSKPPNTLRTASAR